MDICVAPFTRSGSSCLSWTCFLGYRDLHLRLFLAIVWLLLILPLAMLWKEYKECLLDTNCSRFFPENDWHMCVVCMCVCVCVCVCVCSRPLSHDLQGILECQWLWRWRKEMPRVSLGSLSKGKWWNVAVVVPFSWPAIAQICFVLILLSLSSFEALTGG